MIRLSMRQSASLISPAEAQGMMGASISAPAKRAVRSA